MKKTLVFAIVLIAAWLVSGCSGQAAAASEDILYHPGSSQEAPAVVEPVGQVDNGPSETEVQAGLLDNILAAAMPSQAELETDECLICDFDMAQYSGPLSADEVDGLLLALNDEYRAWAIYGQVIIDHGDVRPFTSIQSSEASHINSLIALFNTYGIPVPENPWIGQVPSFTTTPEACAAGVDAEILNSELYDKLFSTTDRQDILDVYTFLQQASDSNHLPAFERCSTGVTGTQSGAGSQYGQGGAGGQGSSGNADGSTTQGQPGGQGRGGGKGGANRPASVDQGNN